MELGKSSEVPCSLYANSPTMDVGRAFIGEDGGLRAPLMYNGVVLGVLAAWKKESCGKGTDEGHIWEEKDKAVLEKVVPPLSLHIPF